METYAFIKDSNGFTITITGANSYSSTPIVNSYSGGDYTISETSNGVYIEITPSDYYSIDISVNTITIDGVTFAGTKSELVDTLRNTILNNSAINLVASSPVTADSIWIGSQVQYDALTPSITTIYYII